MPNPTKDDMTGSLKAAADAAHRAFLAAAAIDPVAAKPLWVDSINASNTYLAALQQQLLGDPAEIKAAKDKLDAQTRDLNTQVQNLQNVATAITFVTSLISLATSVAKFFA